MTQPTIRLHLLLARAAERILIIRRGPTRVFHLVLWDTQRDTFEHGSWFRGALYVRRCDLSFDGQWLVYFAMGPTRELYSWVALSRPPWLRAETLWPKGDTWHGGGIWLGPGRLWLNLAPGTQPRDGDPSPQQLGIRAEQSLARYGEDEGPFFTRLERDGWRRAGEWPTGTAQRTMLGWPVRDDPGWVLQPTPEHPSLRMFFRGYYFNRGRVYIYALDGYPDLLDEGVDWAGYDHAGRLVITRGGAIVRYTLADLARGVPSFQTDFTNMTPPPPPPPRPRAEPPTQEPPPQPGPDAAGHYHYLGDTANLRRAATRFGHPIRGQADLQAISPILRADRTWSFEKPQTYVVTIDGVFVLGGELNEHVGTAGGASVLAAGEATLEEQPDGTWAITALNNRSYGYMPDASSWAAVDRALRPTGIAYPHHGFSEIYPREGTWAEILAVLRS
jgi:hypothetical protein